MKWALPARWLTGFYSLMVGSLLKMLRLKNFFQIQKANVRKTSCKKCFKEYMLELKMIFMIIFFSVWRWIVMKFRIGYRTTKTAIGVAISILLAQQLGLHNFASAGIITILCIQIT